MQFCENCGAQMEDSRKFCPNCGYEVFKVTNSVEESNAVSSAFKFSLIGLIASCTGLGAPVGIVFAVIGFIKAIKAKQLGAIGGRLNTAMILSGLAALIAIVIIAVFASSL